MKNLVDLVLLKNHYVEVYEDATIEECSRQESDSLIQRSNTFRAIMNNQRFLQLRYSVMALLSQGHVCLFNGSLISLIELLLTEEMSGTAEVANFSAFVLNQLRFALDPDENPYEPLD